MKLSLRHLVTFLGIFVVALLSGTTGSQAQGRRVALVIGNSAYVSATKLDNPINDAEDMAATLERLGFAVLKGIDLSKAGMDAIIRQFAEAMGGAKAGLLFYAGHGLQVGGQNYLVPIDAKLTTSSATTTFACTTVPGSSHTSTPASMSAGYQCANAAAA